MASAGRKTKYTPATVKTLEEGIANGLTYTLAAARAGITFETLSQWRKQHPEFSERLAHAEAEAAERRLQAIEAAGQQDWRALAWIMERRHPTEYGKAERQEINAKHELSGPNGQPIAIAHHSFDADGALADATSGSGGDR